MKIQKKINLGGGGGWGGRGRVGGVRVDVNEELKFLGKFKKNIFFGGGGSRGGGVGWGGQGGCERRIEVFVKINLRIIFFFGGGGGVGRGGGGGGEKSGLGGGVDVIKELKF